MNIGRILLVGILIAYMILLTHTSCQNSALGGNSYSGKKIKGISFVAANEPITEEDVTPMKKLGATWVSLMPYGFVRKTESVVVYNSPRQWWGETKQGLEETVNLAKKMGLKVMVKPQIWFRHGEYTGAYLPADSVEVEFKRSFREFVLFYAEVAQHVDADLYCIGTEWHKFIDSDPDYWFDLILQVKQIYAGELTYAANWDEYKTVPFWGEMDYIGVNAYFPISDKKFPNMEKLAEGWRKWREELAFMAKSHSKPIIFTEYGYRSTVSNAENPWESHTRPKVSLENQVLAYQALYEVCWDKPWFAGGFVWKWFHNHEQRGGKEHIGFTPQNKPVEEVIKSFYTNPDK